MAKAVLMRVGVIGIVLTIAMIVIGIASNHPFLALCVPVGFAIGASNLLYATRLKGNIRAMSLATLIRLLIMTILVVGIAVLFGLLAGIVTAISVAISEVLVSSMYAARLLV